MEISIAYATLADIEFLKKNDSHINKQQLKKKIQEKEVIIAQVSGVSVGWLRFGFLWDIIPFMNMLRILKKYQRKGIGSKIVEFWEQEMRKKKYREIMTSSQEDEEGQFFYKELGYHESGKLYEVNKNGVAEIFFIKKLNVKNNDYQ